MPAQGTIAEGVIKIALAGFDVAANRLKQLQTNSQKLGDTLGNIGSMATKGFAVGTASITGFLKAADPVRFEIFTQKLLILTSYIGQMFIPILIKAISWLDKLIAFFKHLDQGTKDTVKKWTEFALKVLAVGAMLTALVGIGLKVYQVLKLISIAVGLLTAETGIGLIVAIAGLVLLLTDLSDGFTDMGGVVEKIKGIFAKFAAGFQKVMDEVMKAVNAVLPTIIELALSIADLLKDAFEAILPHIISFVKLISGALKEAFNDIMPVIKEVIKVLSNELKFVFNALVPVLGKVILAFATFAKNNLATVFKVLGSVLKAVLSIFKEIASNKDLRHAFESLVTTATKLFNVLGSAQNGILKAVGTVFSTLGDVVMKILPVWAKMEIEIVKLIGVFAELYAEVMAVVGEALGDLITSSVATFQAMWNMFGPMIVSNIMNFVAAIKVVVNHIKNMVALLRKAIELGRKLGLIGVGGSRKQEDVREENEDKDKNKEHLGTDFKEEKKSEQVAPLMKIQKPEFVGIEEAFKKAQTGAVQDPTKLYQNEQLKLSREANKNLADLNNKTPEKSSKAEGAF